MIQFPRGAGWQNLVQCLHHVGGALSAHAQGPSNSIAQTLSGQETFADKAWIFTYRLSTFPVYILQGLFPHSFSHEATVLLIQLKGCPGILYRIMRTSLDVLLKNNPGEEAE